jgi:hypothetical protein
MSSPPGTQTAPDYTTGNVQFLWLAAERLADVKSLISLLCPGSADYVVFMFRENALFRISIRLWGGPEGGQCLRRKDFLPDLAARFGLPI